ncbi:hypothetical protein BC828DRAFT_377846 [Blastocladiella britannica]|nr:hypothetical protein BC828DRAFT_377846 [Blastocladiella britannica]
MASYPPGNAPLDILAALEKSSSTKLAKNSHAAKSKLVVKSDTARMFPAATLASDLFWHYYAVLRAHAPLTLATNTVAAPALLTDPQALAAERAAAPEYDAESGAGMYVVELRKPAAGHSASDDHGLATTMEVVPGVPLAHVLNGCRHPFIGSIALTRVRVAPHDLSVADVESDIARLDLVLRPAARVLGSHAFEAAAAALELLLDSTVHGKKVIRKVVASVPLAAGDDAIAAMQALLVDRVSFKREKDLDGTWARWGFGVNEAREVWKRLNPVDMTQGGMGMRMV